jgi:hypothetical protein
MTATTFEGLFTGNPHDTFKGLKTAVFVKDYDPTVSLANFTPFDSATGNFDGTLTTTQGFVCTGYTDENGPEFNPTLTTSDTNTGQSPDVLRKDGTQRALSGMITLLGSNLPVTHALQHQLPLASLPSVGTAGYRVAPEADITLYDRTVLFVAVDKKYGVVAHSLLIPRAVMTKPDKIAWNRKTESTAKFTFESQIEASTGLPYVYFIDGPGWRALGGTTGLPGTPVGTAGATGVVSLAFTAPTTPNGPFTYNVFVDASTTPVDPANVVVGGTTANPVLTVSAQVAGPHTYKVQAIGSNLSTSAKTAASGSVTIT